MLRNTKSDDVLSNIPLFAACTVKERKAINQLITPATLTAGTVVARQGRVGHELAIITKGTATVDIDGVTVATLGAGDFFGEVSLLDGGPQTATITADTELGLEVIEHSDFTKLLIENPAVTVNILKGVATRLRDADRRLAH